MSSATDESEIRETINYYSEGMRTADVERLKKAFHEQAILCGYLGDELITAPIQGLYDWVDANPAPDPRLSCSSPPGGRMKPSPREERCLTLGRILFSVATNWA
jgi:hypothetical protein